MSRRNATGALGRSNHSLMRLLLGPGLVVSAFVLAGCCTPVQLADLVCGSCLPRAQLSPVDEPLSRGGLQVPEAIAPASEGVPF